MSKPRKEPKRLPMWQRVLAALESEVVGIHPRLHAYNLVESLLPARAAPELRPRLLRLVGFSIGPGTVIQGSLKISGHHDLPRNLRVGVECSIGANSVLDLSETITIGDRVTLEPGVMVLTSTHELDFPAHRAGPVITNPVSIGAGAWIRARAVILPGVKIGAGAVVEAGGVVSKDVEPNARVGGIPATKLEVLADGRAP